MTACSPFLFDWEPAEEGSDWPNDVVVPPPEAPDFCCWRCGGVPYLSTFPAPPRDPAARVGLALLSLVTLGVAAVVYIGLFAQDEPCWVCSGCYMPLGY